MNRETQERGTHILLLYIYPTADIQTICVVKLEADPMVEYKSCSPSSLFQICRQLSDNLRFASAN